MMVKLTMLLLLVLVLGSSVVQCGDMGCRDCNLNCGTNDCITHPITQTGCYEVCRKPSHQCQWKFYGLATHTDQEMLGGQIMAYQIQWFNGDWSSWFVPGENDLDCKYNKKSADCGSQKACPNTLRLMWSYFYDHFHRYIICRL